MLDTTGAPRLLIAAARGAGRPPAAAVLADDRLAEVSLPPARPARLAA